jgi:hypothetical protein
MSDQLIPEVSSGSEAAAIGTGLSQTGLGIGHPPQDDVMMDSSTSDSGLGSEAWSTLAGSGKMSTSGSESGRERRESTSSNPCSDVVMMPPSPVSRDQVFSDLGRSF